MLTHASKVIFRANLQDYVPIVELVFVHSRVKFRFFYRRGYQTSIVSRLGGALEGGLLIFRAKYYAFFQIVWKL